MINILLILYFAGSATITFARNVDSYICNNREVLTGNFTSGSGTKVSIDEVNRTATILTRITVPNATWEPTYKLKPENQDEYAAARFISSKELTNVSITFTRVGNYNFDPEIQSIDQTITAALVYKFTESTSGKEIMRIYLCTRESIK